MNKTNEDVEGIKIYCFIGHSDDVFEEDKTGFDCDCCDKEGRFSLRRPNGEGVLITGQYRENGCWHIGVSLLDESALWCLQTAGNLVYSPHRITTSCWFMRLRMPN